MPKAILFDYDGTLLDSVGEVYRGTCNVFRQSGLAEPSFSEFCETYEAPYEPFYRQRGVAASNEEMVGWYFEAARPETCAFYPDVVDVLEALAKRNVLMGIISAHDQEKIALRCQEAGFHSYLRCIVGRAHDKTEFIQNFCRDNGVDPADTFYVGDFVSDVRDAKKAGVIAVGITRGKATSGVLRQAGANHCISDLRELLDLV